MFIFPGFGYSKYPRQGIFPGFGYSKSASTGVENTKDEMVSVVSIKPEGPLLPGEEPNFPPYIKMGPAFLDNNGQRTRFNKPCSLCKMQFQVIQSITPNQDQLVICGHKCKLKTQGVWFEIY